MKKINLILMSILTVLISAVLTACNFKNVEAEFTVSELIVAVDEEIDLDEFLSVKEVDKNEITYLLSNSTLFEMQGRKVKAIASGSSFVYAMYRDNNLASMQIVTKKPFDAPVNIRLDEKGLLKWDAVSSSYGNSSQTTVAQGYVVEGTRTVYDPESSSEILEKVPFSFETETNSLQLSDAGEYVLTVRAKSFGYFEEGIESKQQKFFFGFMQQLTESDMTWNNGLLSWKEIEHSKFKVELNGMLLDDFQTVNYKDLTSYFKSAEAGVLGLRVFVYDAEGKLLARPSETLQIRKLAKPNVTYRNGQLQISQVNFAKQFEVCFSGSSSSNVVLQAEEGVLSTSLNGLASGSYSVEIVAKNNDGLFFESDANAFGKVYKLAKLNVSGKGENQFNGNKLKLQVDGEAIVDTNFSVLGLNETLNGFEAGETSKETSLTLPLAGEFSVQLLQTPKNPQNRVDGAYVLNSDACEEISVVKVAAFESEVSHNVEDDVSILIFKKVEKMNRPENYEVQLFDGTNFVPVSNCKIVVNENVQIRFNGKIEELFDAVEIDGKLQYKFRIVAKTANDLWTINSTTSKALVLLPAPKAVERAENSAELKYFWQVVDGAWAYRFNYTLNGETFTETIVPNENNLSADGNQICFTFAKEGLYSVEIFALSPDINLTLSSKESLKEDVRVCKQLELGKVEFGFNKKYQSDFTEATGFFISIEKTQDVDVYEVLIASKSVEHKISDSEKNVYLLTENFANETNIEIVGKSNRPEIYLATETYSFKVATLNAVSANDFVVDETGKMLTLSPKDGVSKIVIQGEGKRVVAEGKAAEFALPNVANFSLNFELTGSKVVEKEIFDEANQLQETFEIYEISNGEVWLSSGTTKIDFQRPIRPTNLCYENGTLKFVDNSQVGNIEYFVLDLVFTDANNVQKKFSVRFGCIGGADGQVSRDVVTVVYEGQRKQLKLNNGENVRSGDLLSLNASERIIQLNSTEDRVGLIDLLKADETLAPYYNQARNLTFSVYGYQNRVKDDKVQIATLYGSIATDASQDKLSIQKMNAVEVSFERTTNSLVWTKPSTDEALNSQTTYVISSNAWTEDKTVTGGNSFDLSSVDFKPGEVYTFTVTATNPRFLESANSRLVEVCKLKTLSKVTLSEKFLTFNIEEKERVDFVKVTVGANSFENTNGRVEITEEGLYSFQLVGKIVETKNENEEVLKITYFLDSDVSTWILSSMQNLAAENLTVNFAGNRIEWNAFTSASLSALEYVLTFEDQHEDGENHFFSFVTKGLAVDLQEASNLFESISKLAEGNIKVNVYAHLAAYDVLAGQTVYFFKESALGFNYFPYSTEDTIKKLSTPQVEKVEFSYDADEESAGYLTDAQKPEIKVTFTGNYGEGQFQIFVNGTNFDSLNVAYVDGKYQFVLQKEVYDNLVDAGEVLTLKIKALNVGVNSSAIPSNEKTIEIERASNLQAVNFEVDESANLAQKLQFEVAEENVTQILGGVVFKVSYISLDGLTGEKFMFAPSAGEASNILQFGFENFVAENLASGGTMTVSAFVNSHANDQAEKYILASPNFVTSQEVEVLRSVKEQNLLRKEGGFAISDKFNSANTKYVVIYKDSKFELNAENEFAFIFPDDWNDGTYSMTIQAFEEGKICSAINTISVSLARITAVAEVKLSRLENNELSLSWNAVENATGYIFNMYSREDKKLIYTFKLESVAGESQVSCTLERMFGVNYQNLIDFGVLTSENLESDLKVTLGLVSMGNETVNNSKEFIFNATIKGSSLTEENLRVTNGVLEFDSEINETYLYRFVSSDGQVHQNWKEVKANASNTKLDTSLLDANTAFQVEIIVKGSTSFDEISSSNENNFSFDSIPLSTTESEKHFRKTDDIQNVTTCEENPSDILFELNSFEESSKILVGTTESAMMLDNFIEIQPERKVDNKFAFNLAKIISLLEDAKFEIGQNLFFWMFKTEEQQVRYVNSNVFEFKFNTELDLDFIDIVKVGNVTDDAGEIVKIDFINSFAKFKNTDNETTSTIGFYVEIKQLESVDEEQYCEVKFVSKEEFSTLYFDDNTFAINLTQLFEQTDLQKKAGKFAISFAKLAEVDGGFKMSKWYKVEQFFDRLPQTTGVRVVEGNLQWRYSSENEKKFLIHFADSVNEENQIEGNHFFCETPQNIYDATNDIFKFNASETLNKTGLFNIGVQSINENPYIISSSIAFYCDDEANLIQIYKNQINSPLKLEGGVLKIDWTQNSDFVELLLNTEMPSTEKAEKLIGTVFTVPFTFTLKDLVDSNIIFRFKFSPISGGNAQSFDVNAVDLITNLYDFDGAKENLESVLIAGASSTTSKEILEAFIAGIENGSYGVANSKVLFDRYFENLQTGEYSLQYSLLGKFKSLNSGWYEYENPTNKNEIYVNNEPNVSVQKETNQIDKKINVYRVLVKKSQIYDFDSENNVILRKAKNYVLKIGNYVFAIVGNDSGNWSLTLNGSEKTETVTVIECDGNFNPQTNGEYFAFYINYNEGNSLLGVYGDEIEKNSWDMELYAVGNRVSTSSKSKLFNITFLDFADFSVVDGQFVWSNATMNRTTSVFFKKSDSIKQELEEVEGTRATSTFSLNRAAGEYSIWFVLMGEVKNNSIFIDSDIYTLSRIYKLGAPVLTNDRGLISINNQFNNNYLQNTYSESNPYRYRLFNNNSTSSNYITLMDSRENKTAPFTYEPGITGMSVYDPDYAYKVTEKNATSFKAFCVGSTASLTAERSEKIHMKELVCENSNKRIALRSDIGGFDLQDESVGASMMDAVNVMTIEDGMLKWNAVTSGGPTGQNLTLEDASVVYRVSLVEYTTSLENGTVIETNTGVQKTFFTTLNQFDFAFLKASDFENLDGTYLKATVQALALNVSETYVSNAIELVEGGYAYGNVKYAGTETYVLIGNGTQINEISRLQKVRALRISEQKLVWQFLTNELLTPEEFKGKYSFVVVDDEESLIDGSFEVVRSAVMENNKYVYNVTFADRNMKAGTYQIQVYTTQGPDNQDKTIKSFAETAVVTKLESLDANSFEISSDETSETLSLAKYFEKAENADNVLTAQIAIGSETKVVEFSKIVDKIYIVEEEININYPSDYVQDCLVVGQTDVLKLTFVARRQGTISSNQSEEIVLKRSAWEEQQIEWNEEKQEFSWQYPYFSLNRPVDTEVVQLSEDGSSYVNVTNENGENLLQTLDGNNLFTIVDKDETKSIVKLEETLLRLETSEIVSPTFYVEVTYYRSYVDSLQNEVLSSRTYTTPLQTFQPTLICDYVGLKVKVKLSNSSIQSQDLCFDGVVSFNLFASGEGTERNPYQIRTKSLAGEGLQNISAADQFVNIKHRQTKDENLQSYVIGKEKFETETQYFFQINEDINLTDLNFGLLFKGDFNGIIDAQGHSISYQTSGVEKLSASVRVNNNDTHLNPSTSLSYLEFVYGSSLFETLTNEAIIKNLNLNVKFGTKEEYITRHSLMAGLAIKNNGKVENVNMTNFENNFTGAISYNDTTIMSYSGIVSVNQGVNAVVTGCNALSSMQINDNAYSQLIFVSGIVYLNHATIRDCTAGNAENLIQFNVRCQEVSSGVQIAGIATTCSTTATIENCSNSATITASSTSSENSIVAYLAGICNLVNGSYDESNLSNSGTIYASGISTVRQAETIMTSKQ